MSQNLQLKTIAAEYADDQISEAEFIHKILDEIALGHPTSFWCKVMQLKDDHDYATEPLKR